MDTKFKNKDLLITVLDRCLEFQYRMSMVVKIRYLLVNHNTTFENALCICENAYEKQCIHRKISQMYHSYIRVFNMNKSFKKKQKENNDKIQK